MNKKGIFMKRGSTLFLRAAIIAMGLAVLTLCAVTLPAMFPAWTGELSDVAYLQYPAIFGVCLSAISFFTALYQAMKLLNYIDKNKAFSEDSIRTLKYIKYCAFVVGGVYAAGLPLVYFMAQLTDAPGIMVIGLIFTFAPIVIGVFAGVFQRLLQNAIDIKSENDLTV